MDMSRMTVAVGRTGRAVFLGLFGLAAVSAFGAAAQTAAQRAACTPDAMRLCAAAIPDVGRVTACMQSHRASLSDGCRAAMGADAPPSVQAAARPSRAHAVAPGGHPGRAATTAPRRHRHVAAHASLGLGGGRGSKQGMLIALQVVSALSAACQNPSTSAQLCGVTNGLMGSMGSMGGMGALAGLIK